MCVCKGRRNEGKRQLNRFTKMNRFKVESIQWAIESIQSLGQLYFLLIRGQCAKTNYYSQFNSFWLPKPLPSPLKLPRVHPTRVSTNPSIQDHPAAIGVKISSMVLEEYTFTSKEICFEAVAVQSFLFGEEFSTWSHRSQRYITNHVSLGVLLIVCNSNEK